MSLNNMNKLVNSINKMVEASEKLALPVVSAKLRKVAELHPHDQTIISMANIVSSLAKKQTFISQSEFKGLYNKFQTRNTKFAEYFSDELGDVQDLSTPTLAPRNEMPIASDYGTVADPVLANALNTAFGNNTVIKVFSKDIALRAKKAVALNLDRWNLKASRLEVAAGNAHFIVVQADYDTPKGLTSVLVPVEVQKDMVLEPSVFMSNAGPKDLNHVNLKGYVSANAGSKLQIKANDVIDVLTQAISENREVSELDLALTRYNSTKEHVGGFGQVTGLTVSAEAKNFQVNLPKTAEVETFESKFSTPAGIANFKFGSDKVSLGRDIIARELAGFGIKGSQVSVLNCDDTTVFYAVATGRTAFKVPVKFANNRVVNPSFLLCNGSIMPFTKQTINKMLVTDQTDFKMAAAASSQNALRPADLLNNVRAAVEEGNYDKAEDALNVLQQQGDEMAYTVAFNLYMAGLGTKTASATESAASCSMIVKSASSQHPICGHTGLPTHKVYQDEHGNCQPLYRRGMAETSPGGFFMTSKILG